LAHAGCNSDKSDLLAACGHLTHWRERNEQYRTDLEAFSNSTIISDELTSLGVARWAYAHAHTSKSQVWVGHGITEPLDTSFNSILA